MELFLQFVWPERLTFPGSFWCPVFRPSRQLMVSNLRIKHASRLSKTNRAASHRYCAPRPVCAKCSAPLIFVLSVSASFLFRGPCVPKACELGDEVGLHRAVDILSSPLSPHGSSVLAAFLPAFHSSGSSSTFLQVSLLASLLSASM